MLSSPAQRVWIQRRLGHTANTARRSSRDPDQFKIAVAVGAASAKAAASLPIVCGISLSLASCGSMAFASTSIDLSLFISTIVPCSRREVRFAKIKFGDDGHILQA